MNYLNTAKMLDLYGVDIHTVMVSISKFIFHKSRSISIRNTVFSLHNIKLLVGLAKRKVVKSCYLSNKILIFQNKTPCSEAFMTQRIKFGYFCNNARLKDNRQLREKFAKSQWWCNKSWMSCYKKNILWYHFYRFLPCEKWDYHSFFG